MSVSMVFPAYNRQKRLEKVLNFWKKLTDGASKTDDGNSPIGYDDDTYKSESATADRNWCLGYMMKECNAWPDCKFFLVLFFKKMINYDGYCW